MLYTLYTQHTDQQPGADSSRDTANKPIIPGHVLHKKGLRGQKGVGPLVSSQKEKELAVPVINRGSTANIPRVNR